MLNEIKEVESYLKNPDADDVRLNASLLSENFKVEYKLEGIGDVLTLIACHYLYSFCNTKIEDEETEYMVILIMRIWCGFENDVTDEEMIKAKQANKLWFEKYPQAEGWLKVYHNKYLQRVGDWTIYSQKWSEHLKSDAIYSVKAIRYGNILAQAVARGPLKEYYLVVDKKYEEAVNNKEEIQNENHKKPDIRKRRSMLKLLGAYKVLQLLHPGQKYVVMQKNRILNWLGLCSYTKDRMCVEYKWRGEPIFLLEEHKDFLKFSINQEFLKEMDVKLQDNSNDIPDGRNIYRDNGHGEKNELINI